MHGAHSVFYSYRGFRNNRNIFVKVSRFPYKCFREPLLQLIFLLPCDYGRTLKSYPFGNDNIIARLRSSRGNIGTLLNLTYSRNGDDRLVHYPCHFGMSADRLNIELMTGFFNLFHYGLKLFLFSSLRQQNRQHHAYYLGARGSYVVSRYMDCQ